MAQAWRIPHSWWFEARVFWRPLNVCCFGFWTWNLTVIKSSRGTKTKLEMIFDLDLWSLQILGIQHLAGRFLFGLGVAYNAFWNSPTLGERLTKKANHEEHSNEGCACGEFHSLNSCRQLLVSIKAAAISINSDLPQKSHGERARSKDLCALAAMTAADQSHWHFWKSQVSGHSLGGGLAHLVARWPQFGCCFVNNYLTRERSHIYQQKCGRLGAMICYLLHMWLQSIEDQHDIHIEIGFFDPQGIHLYVCWCCRV